MIPDQTSGARVSTIENVLLGIPVKGLLHLSERPVRHRQDLKSSSKTLRQALLN